MIFDKEIKLRLETVCKKITDGSHYSPKSVTKGYPMASVKNLTYFDISIEECRKISKEDYLKLIKNDCKPLKNDVLVAKDGSYLKNIIVIRKERDIVVLSSIAILRPDLDKINPYYLKYYLLNPESKNRIKQGYASGSALPRIILKDFKKFGINLRDLKEQEKIASILSSLDDKIELNNQINKNLEKIAQIIFKHWFIEFEFPNENGEPYKSSSGKMMDSELGQIPKGWKIGKIGDYVKVKSGFAFKNKWWGKHGIPVIKIKNIKNKTIDFSSISCISMDKINGNISKFFVTSGDILIAMTGATVGKIALVPKRKGCTLVNQRVGKFFLGKKPLKKVGFIYSILTRTEIFLEIVSTAHGSAQPNISPSQIENIKIVLPSRKYIEKYNKIVEPAFCKITENINQNEYLSNLRDALLPKLMSGEI